MTCRLCLERGKTWKGEDPKCAFPSGVFESDNWNCATMNKLREISHPSAVYSNDQWCKVIPTLGGEFVILGWYKERGRTEYATLLDSDTTHALLLTTAELVISRFNP